MVQVIENIPSTVNDIKYETELAVMTSETEQSSIVSFRATAVTGGWSGTQNYNLTQGCVRILESFIEFKPQFLGM